MKVRKLKRKILFGIKVPAPENLKRNDVKEVLSVNPHYFTDIENRKIKPNNSIRLYKQNIRNILLLKYIFGVYQDEILRIDHEMKVEKKAYDNAVVLFEDVQKSFNKFLADDNDTTIDLIKRSDQTAKMLLSANEDHKDLCFQLSSLKSNVKYTEESLFILLSFQEFLYKLSPVLWLENNPIEFFKEKSIVKFDADVFKAVDVNSVETVFKSLPPKVMYFYNPEQLMDIFEMCEKQNLYYLLVGENIQRQKIGYSKLISSLKQNLLDEMNIYELKMNQIEDNIKAIEARENETETMFFKMLMRNMKHLITSKRSLKLFISIEYTYEMLIDKNETDLPISDMIFAIEDLFNDLVLQLSTFDLSLVKEIQRSVYESEKIKINQAIVANKILKDVRKLKKRMNIAHNLLK